MKLKQSFEGVSSWKLLLKYSVPGIIASGVHSLYNIVDRIYIGNGLGVDALAGVTLTFPVFILSIALGILISSGASSIISIKLGEKDLNGAEETLGNTFGMFAILGVIVTILGLVFLKPLLYQVGATENTFPYAYDYLIWFIPFMTFDFLAMGTNGSIRSEGNPTRAMRIAITGALINIALDPLFLFVFDMGVKGVAIATAIARVITTILVIYHFTKGSLRNITLHLRNIIPKWQIVKPMIAIGSSPFIMSLATVLVAVVLNRSLVAHGGELALGALGVIHSIFVIVETPLMGLMMASQPIIGYNYGAKRYDKLKEILKLSYIYSLIISVTGLLSIILFGKFFILLFNQDNPELIKLGYRGLIIFMCMIPFAGIQMMSTMFYQAIGSPKKSILLNMLRKVVIFLPVLYILPHIIHLDGVWGATPVADFLSGLIAITLIYKDLKSESYLTPKLGVVG